MARIDLIDVCKTLTDQGTKSASTFSMQGLNLRIPDGKTLVVLGPSGCGKTTLLKIIAGLIPPDSGEVRSDGVEVNDSSARDRRIGMVFQNYALYPHFSSPDERAGVLPLQEEDAGAGCDGQGEVSEDERAHGRGARVPPGPQADHLVRWREAAGRPRAVYHPRCGALPGGRALRQSGSGAAGEVSGQSEGPPEAVQHHDGVRDPRSPRGVDPGGSAGHHGPRRGSSRLEHSRRSTTGPRASSSPGS